MTAGTTEVSLTRDGDVFVLDLGSGENRFNPNQIAAIAAAIDEVEATAAPRALVTVADGKFWSNGLDLDWMGANPDQLQPALDAYHHLLAATLAASVPTVAAIQGHAFAAGAMFATAHDHIVMRADRGYWCVPEVALRMPFTPGMAALLQARLSKRTAHKAMTTGRRYTGEEALASGIVDELADLADIRARAIEIARPLATSDPATLRTIKERMYAETLAALRNPQVV